MVKEKIKSRIPKRKMEISVHVQDETPRKQRWFVSNETNDRATFNSQFDQKKKTKDNEILMLLWSFSLGEV